MPPFDEAPKLRCPVSLFEACESRIRALSLAINEAEGAEKAALARELLEENEQLLACKEFDENDNNCVLCRNFATLRHKTASLVVQMMTTKPTKGEDE
jgi:hypothetical protein